MPPPPPTHIHTYTPPTLALSSDLPFFRSSDLRFAAHPPPARRRRPGVATGLPGLDISVEDTFRYAITVSTAEAAAAVVKQLEAELDMERYRNR